jgi:GTP-binding protein
MFADQARILVVAGAGGDGSASFRREAHVPRGGPDGGDGGKGGDVVLEAEAGMTTLAELRRRRHARASAGGRGARRRSHGRNGADVVLRVPPGTVARIAERQGEARQSPVDLGELLAPGDRLVVARGGSGGRGNVHFASPTHRAPTHFEKGQPGEEHWIELELKLIADIGLVGAPNAGKSTLLAALTAARPEVGAFAFTTTSPNLGVLAFDEDHTAVIADLPGLIEGAHSGRGLGHAFLRHAERTRVLVAVVDGAARDPAGEWRAVEDELRLRDPELLERPMPTVVTKLDLPAVREHWPALRRELLAAGHRPLAVSAHDGTGLDELRDQLRDALQAAAATATNAASPPVRVHRFDPLESGWQVIRENGTLRVKGRRIENAAARIDFGNDESRDRFQHTLERLGIDAELRRQGAAPGTLVRIGRVELEWGEDE